MFPGLSGTRYLVELRVGQGSGEKLPCLSNFYPDRQCTTIISSGQGSCAADFCADCGKYAHFCDLACNFLCPEDGITDTQLDLLPPGATEESQIVATQTAAATDKGLAFTAAATGTMTVRVTAMEGSGPVTAIVTVQGTAEERSPPLRDDALPHLLGVSCIRDSCAFEYDGATMYDGDGSGADLLLPHAEAGRAYAILVQLTGDTAAQVTATFYQSGAAAGAAGFEAVVSGPMGEWTSTPPPSPCTDNRYDLQMDDPTDKCDNFISSGQLSCAADFCAECGDYAHYCDHACGFLCEHKSFAEHYGCSNDHPHCVSSYASFIHPVRCQARFSIRVSSRKYVVSWKFRCASRAGCLRGISQAPGSPPPRARG